MTDKRPLPEVLFFDLGDTLMRPRPSWAAVYRQGLLAGGIEIAEQDIEQAMRKEADSGKSWELEEPFEPTEAGAWQRIAAFDAAILARLGHTDLPESVFRAIEDAFALPSAWFVYPDVVPALDAMQAAGVRLCVISNFVWNAPDLLHDVGLASHFDELVISSRVGFQKPMEGIFRIALERMAVEPNKAMHIGDSYRADVVGARRVGIEAVLMDRSRTNPTQVREMHHDPNLPVVASMFELLALLGLPRPALASI